VSAAGAGAVERIPVPVLRPLARLRGTIEDLLSNRRYAANEDSWCSVVLTDAIRPPGAMERLRARFPHTIELSFDPVGVSVLPVSYAARVQGRDDLDICCDFVTHVRGGAAPDAGERDLLGLAVDAARTARRLADDEGVAGPARREESA